MAKLSCIVPCYNEEESLEHFFKECTRIAETMENIEFEIIFVDDGSKDKTLEVVKDFANKDKRVKWVSFSRNFGKEAAMYAGLQNASGDYVVIIDADLQDPPKLIPQMHKLLTDGECDIVGTRRVTRKGEPPIRSFFARRFYKLINKISKTDIVDGARDFQMMSRKVVDAILSMKEYNRFSKGIFEWVGFKKKWLEYENVERVAGETKWSFWKLVLYAIEGIVAFSTVPLAIASIIGILFFMLAIVFIIFIIVRTLLFGDNTSGWPSLVCIIMLISGIQMFCMGILGQYLARTYMESKQRPIYIVGDTNIDN